MLDKRYRYPSSSESYRPRLISDIPNWLLTYLSLSIAMSELFENTDLQCRSRTTGKVAEYVSGPITIAPCGVFHVYNVNVSPVGTHGGFYFLLADR